ncbi:MAG: hypothetical protein ACE5HT_10670 [Gemmatimonadales bacterium]
MASSSPLPQKLHIKQSQRIIVLNAPEGYLKRLGVLPAGVEMARRATGKFDLVHLFVKNVAELQRLGPKALKILKYDAVLWISYPKKSSKVETDISRDVGWDLLRQAGLRPVAAVSIDDTWSALRFRPVAEVGK